MTRCDPDLPARRALEARLLGGRGDFAGFVRAMRAEFKALAAAEAAAAGGGEGAAA